MECILLVTHKLNSYIYIEKMLRKYTEVMGRPEGGGVFATKIFIMTELVTGR